jgi:hypothetical protein
MSSFSEWNGPVGGYGAGPQLPSVQSLQNLIERIGVLTTELRALDTAFVAHKDLTINGSSSSQLHGDIKTYVNSQTQVAVDSLKDATLGFMKIKDAYDKAVAAVEPKFAGVATSIAQVQAMIEPAVEMLRETLVGKLSDTTTAYTFRGVQNYLTALQQTLDNTATAVNTTTLTLTTLKSKVAGALISVTDVLDCTNIFATLWIRYYTDFRNMAFINGQVVPIAAGNPYPNSLNSVVLVGVLSDVWDETKTEDHVPVLQAKQREKAARVYLKFVNSEPWNAIIDMTVTKDPNKSGPSSVSGSMYAIASITAGRPPLDPTFPKDDQTLLAFGLYTGTSSDGKEHVYLGVLTGDVLGQPSYLSGTMNLWPGQTYHIAGNNFLPLTPAMYSNSGVVEITRVQFEHSGMAIDKLIASSWIETNEYRDLQHNGVAVTDYSKNTLTIGDPDVERMRSLKVYSTDRPSVFMRDLAEHKVAFLTDLSQSLYWQRSVDIIMPDFDTVAASVVYIRSLTDETIVSPNTAGAVAVPGYYTTDPSGATTSGVIFQNLQHTPTALVRNGGTTATLVDGKYGGVWVNAGTPLQLSSVSGLDISRFAPGVTLEDQNDQQLVVLVVTPQTNEFTANLVAPGQIHNYIEPAYYTFVKGTATGDFGHWEAAGAIRIAVPATFDADGALVFITDVTYEWAGASLEQDRLPGVDNYYVPSYVTWTPHHDNLILYPEFENVPEPSWGELDLGLDGFRGVVRQDEIDNSLQLLAAVQPDFYEQRPTINWQRPEQEPVRIANPAHINDRPWSGIAVLDGGTFLTPSMYETWYVDGGDFTNMVANFNNALRPVPSTNFFGNSIQRLFRGLYTKQPELQYSNVPQAIWNQYGNTLRWGQFETGNPPVRTSEGVLAFSDPEAAVPNEPGKYGRIFNFIPLESYKSESNSVLQSFSEMFNVEMNTFTRTFEWTDFSTIGIPVVQSATYMEGSDSAFPLSTYGFTEDTPTTPLTLLWIYASDTHFGSITTTSPRTLRLEQNVVWKGNANWPALTSVGVPLPLTDTGTFSFVLTYDNPTLDHNGGGVTTFERTLKFQDDGNNTVDFEVTDDLADGYVVTVHSPRIARQEDLLTDETNNRIAGDNTLGTLISEETTRANAVEETLLQSIAAVASEAGAQVTAEATRAEAAETTLQTNIDTEYDRANTKENELTQGINDEATARIAADVALDTRVTELETVVGDASSGLVDEVDNLNVHLNALLAGGDIPQIPSTPSMTYTLQAVVDAGGNVSFAWV